MSRDGLRSGPKTWRPRFIGKTACNGFTAASRQIAGKPRSYAFGRSGSAYAQAFDSGRRPWERSLLAMGCAAAPNLATEIPQGKPRATVLLPLRARSRASHAPTPSAEADRRTHRLLILAEGRGSAACSRWAAQRPQTRRPRFHRENRVQRFSCRFAPDRGQAGLLRLRQKRIGASGQERINAFGRSGS